MKIEQVKVADLKPYEKNARTHPESQIKQIARSIEEFGFNNPILATREGRIIAGHGRVEAAKVLNLDTVPVVRIEHLSPEQIQAYTLADNQLALTSRWDADALVEEIKELYGIGFDLDLLGFDPSELAAMLEVKPEIDESLLDEVPEVEEVAITKAGDLWELGDHRLLCGDSTRPEDVALLMNGEKAELMFTDPPYGVDYEGGHFHSGDVNIKRKREKLAADNNAEIYEQFLGVALRFVDGPCYMFFADSKAYPVYKALHDNKAEIHALIIWHKINATYAALNAQYKQRHEPCLYFKPKGSTLRWIGPTNECTIWEIKRDAVNDLHPTQKPIDLALRGLQNHKADLILDCFGGSGSTLVAAQQLGRKARVLEISPQYCDVIIKRWQKLTGKRALNLNTGDYFGGTIE